MIGRLTAPVTDADLEALADVLVDAVESDAAVSFIRFRRASAFRVERQQRETGAHAVIFYKHLDA